MNPNYLVTIAAKVEPTEAHIAEAKNIVIAAIKKKERSSCYYPDIDRENNGRVPHEAVSKAISELITDRVIRQKEDFIEHDWEYYLL